MKTTGVSIRNHELKQIIKFVSENHYIVGSQKNGKKIHVTEFNNGKKIGTKKFQKLELYWEDWFKNYSTVCINY